MAEARDDVKEMSEAEIVDRIVRLGFRGDRALYEEFLRRLRAGLPRGTRVAMRGSVITNQRWADGGPFDAAGEGTSDLDVTLIGDEVIGCWEKDALYPLGLHTLPLCDEDPGTAPRLEPLRRELQALVGRPVNFQATTDVVLFARDVLLGQPYHVLIDPQAEAEAAAAEGAGERGDAG